MSFTLLHRVFCMFLGLHSFAFILRLLRCLSRFLCLYPFLSLPHQMFHHFKHFSFIFVSHIFFCFILIVSFCSLAKILLYFVLLCSFAQLCNRYHVFHYICVCAVRCTMALFSMCSTLNTFAFIRFLVRFFFLK